MTELMHGRSFHSEPIEVCMVWLINMTFGGFGPDDDIEAFFGRPQLATPPH